MFHDVTAKLGNMRKTQEWTVYPIDDGATDVVIQCDQRIAKIDLKTGKGLLSSGKGGHQGFMMLSSIMGAKEIDAPAELLEELRRLAKYHAGEVTTLMS
jgi:hypothetical protein